MAKKIIVTENKKLEIRRFWKWFATNRADIEDSLIAGDGVSAAELRHRLRRLSCCVGYQMLAYRKSNTFNLSFNMGGRRRYLPLTQALVEACPGFVNWEFEPFTPPRGDLSEFRDGTDSGYEFGESRIYISQMKYKVERYDINNRVMHITIYLPTYRFHFDHPQFEDSINFDIEFITGEFLFKHNLRIVGYAQLEDEHKNLPNVYELAEKLDELREIKKRARMAVMDLVKG